MELRQLRYLVAAVDEGTVTAAAAALHVAQPGVSAQLRQLERELGATLLERGPRSVTPTEVGRAVLEHARAALASVDAARDAVAALNGLLRGRVAVGMATSLPDTVLADPVGDFAAGHPQLEVVLREGTTDELVDALRSGGLDVAVAGFPTGPPDGLSGRVLVESALVAAVAPDDEFAGRAALPLAELVTRPLICLPRGHGLRTALDAALAAHGLTGRVGFESGAMTLLLRLAARGAGVAVVPEPAFGAAGVRALERPPVAVPLDPEVRTRLYLVWRGGGPSGPAARALLAALLQRV
ncbi:LysR family transcriptional regulator [Pseudonocardia spirodelae]|uniref:LysR family transcriptional regulator n=1 Tax=Pseudonocardia spirodelae TaxID=3133431 RepID=A0ABU8T9R0_9PSEU